MRAAVEPLGVALLAGKPDTVDPGQPLRLTYVANKNVHGFLNSTGGMKASIDSAMIACPVLVALAVSLTKSITSRPTAARLSAPASKAMIRLKP